jgi:hypothetical protein
MRSVCFSTDEAWRAEEEEDGFVAGLFKAKALNEVSRDTSVT